MSFDKLIGLQPVRVQSSSHLIGNAGSGQSHKDHQLGNFHVVIIFSTRSAFAWFSLVISLLYKPRGSYGVPS